MHTIMLKVYLYFVLLSFLGLMTMDLAFAKDPEMIGDWGLNSLKNELKNGEKIERFYMYNYAEHKT